MSTQQEFSINIKQNKDYQFTIDFSEFGKLITDEPEPLGKGSGPNPARLLIASVGNCLCASLLFSINKFHQKVLELSATVTGIIERVEGYWRVTKIQVTISLNHEANTPEYVQKALAQFEQFCVVTQSVRAGIDVTVEIE